MQFIYHQRVQFWEMFPHTKPFFIFWIKLLRRWKDRTGVMNHQLKGWENGEGNSRLNESWLIEHFIRFSPRISFPSSDTLGRSPPGRGERKEPPQSGDKMWIQCALLTGSGAKNLLVSSRFGVFFLPFPRQQFPKLPNVWWNPCRGEIKNSM